MLQRSMHKTFLALLAALTLALPATAAPSAFADADSASADDVSAAVVVAPDVSGSIEGIERSSWG
jgi:hypothetical protein